jgi:hypothetical protein
MFLIQMAFASEGAVDPNQPLYDPLYSALFDAPAGGMANSTEAASRATIKRSPVTAEHVIHELPQLQHLES